MIEDIIIFGKSLCMDVEFQEKLSLTQKYKYGQSFSISVSRSTFSLIHIFWRCTFCKNVLFFFFLKIVYTYAIYSDNFQSETVFAFSINQLDQSIIHLVTTHPNQLINPNSEYIFIVFSLNWEHELPSFCYVSWVNYLFHTK